MSRIFNVTVDAGRFGVNLPAGRHQLLGHPDNRDIMSMRARAFRVEVGRTVNVDLVEPAT